MVWVPAGSFAMGSSDREIEEVLRREPRAMRQALVAETPRRTVTLEGFWVYRDEVTVSQYRRFCEETGRPMPRPPADGWKDKHPIVNVSWHDANAYCKWAGVRLPTEAEWERAARGTDARLFVWGNSWPPVKRVGNFADISAKKVHTNWTIVPGYDDGFVGTAPAGSFPEGRSAAGCTDMAGNVWEWCADWYDARYYSYGPDRDPRGPEHGTHKVVRGGSFSNFGMDFLRTTFRSRWEPGAVSEDRGFRCAWSGPPPASDPATGGGRSTAR